MRILVNWSHSMTYTRSKKWKSIVWDTVEDPFNLKMQVISEDPRDLVTFHSRQVQRRGNPSFEWLMRTLVNLWRSIRWQVRRGKPTFEWSMRTLVWLLNSPRSLKLKQRKGNPAFEWWLRTLSIQMQLNNEDPRKLVMFPALDMFKYDTRHFSD